MERTEIRVGYVSLKVALHDGTALYKEILNESYDGKQLSPHELHMTLMYDSTNPIPTRAIPAVSKASEEYEATIMGIDLLGEIGSKYRAVVVLLESPGIRQRFDELSVLMTHSFEEFKPHVSLIYGASEDDLEKVRKLLTHWIGTRIVLYGESFSTVKED